MTAISAQRSRSSGSCRLRTNATGHSQIIGVVLTFIVELLARLGVLAMGRRGVMTRTTALTAASALIVLIMIAASIPSPVDAQQLKSRTNPPSPWTGCCQTCSHGSCSECSELIGEKCVSGTIKADCTTIADDTICVVPKPRTNNLKAN